MIEELLDALTARRLAAQEIAGTLNVRAGTGPLARAANLDPTPTLAWIAARPQERRAQDIASWASGVATAMAEPARSDARGWSFVEAAGSIFPTIEGAAYTHGVRDVTGEDAWVQPLGDSGLVVGWILRLRRGIRPLTAAHVEDWNVTVDRVLAAGRSLLYHSTQGRSWSPTDAQDVLALRLGDGHDAARLLIAEDFFFGEVDGRWRFAIPHQDALLAVRSPEHLDALRTAAAREASAAAYPLDPGCWMLRAGRPQPAEDA